MNATICSPPWSMGWRPARGAARDGVKFLVDAQLPLRLVRVLGPVGHDVVHSSQLPEGNRTTDAVFASLADADDRIVVTKDFEVSHLVRQKPRRLLLVTTGNIANNDLLDLVARYVG